MIRLFLTSVQKYGRWIASVKCVERRVERDPRRRQADDLVVRLERGRDHPEHREHHHDEDGEPDQRPSRAGALHVSTPIRTMRRTYTTLSTADDREHQQRDRGAAAVVALEVALFEEVDAHQEVAGRDLRLADQQVRLREDAEVPDDREAREDEQDRAEDRQRDVAELHPRARPVDRRRLEEIARHLREARRRA